MTAYPIHGDYEIAVRNLDRLVLAQRFKDGAPRKNGFGLVSYSGGFCIVFPIDLPGRAEALRCWIKDPGHVQTRWDTARDYLARNPLPYFADFGFIERGIVVNGNVFPIAYMRWIPCPTLRSYIEKNVHRSDAMQGVAAAFLRMAAQLHHRRIAHGDLQDGNILVCEERRPGEKAAVSLRLVDYDSLYVPTMPASLGDGDVPGLPAYQHPRRRSWHNEHADYFSELVIYLSLLAYAERPDLWDEGQEKRLLFTEDDFRAPDRSRAFDALRGMSPPVRFLGAALRAFAIGDPDDVPPLDEVVAQLPKDTNPVRDFFAAWVPPKRGARPAQPPPPSAEPRVAAPARTNPAPATLQDYFKPRDVVARPAAPKSPATQAPAAAAAPSPAQPAPSRAGYATPSGRLMRPALRLQQAACAIVGGGWGLAVGSAAWMVGRNALAFMSVPWLVPLVMLAFGYLSMKARPWVWPAIRRRGLRYATTAARYSFAVGLLSLVVAFAITTTGGAAIAFDQLVGMAVGFVALATSLGLLTGSAVGLVRRD